MNAIKAHSLFYKLRLNADYAYKALERFIEGEPTKKDAVKLVERIKKHTEQIEKAVKEIREDLADERIKR